MPLFEWQGKSVTGEIRSGVLDAPNQQLVEVYLRRLNIIPIKIKPKKETTFALFRRKSVSGKDLTTFTRQFAVVLEAGLPIVKSLEVLAEQQKNPYFKNVLKEIKLKVETGSSLSDAMAEYPKVFDSLYVHMVRSGETSGNLDVILKRLAGYLERILSLKSKIKHAMVYPSLIVIVTIAVISIIMLFVIPKFAEIYESAGQALPLPTQILISISNNFGKILIVFIILLAGLIIGIRYYRNTEIGRYNTDKIIFSLPLLGELFKKAAVARVARTLANLIGGGVPLLPALTIAGETSGNKVLEKAMEEVRINVSAGQSLADPMFYTGVFPYLLVEMVRVGELTGRLEDMLNRVADFFEEEVDRMVNTLSTLIEPILIVFLGIVIGGILISLYLPIFKLGEVIGGMK
ncbi:Type II secretion system F domain protein [Thermodesulfobacterium geofontis OPF15]|uniref:Type II secretion system F domain protein n=1 Tax=Thermodesulfobacterium geofontis (strain OPF15) TaxID=795359 RepID=F8C5G2_THEGP|nr:type II secretion system F family protein [Thermodesulfobacterium geofontis]AEH22937.1 Type II secretion system F domain protein [Thermodesulfobacterium geofontis OPF15]